MLARNSESVKLGRTNRFLIDDDDSPLKLAYTLSKPLKLGWVHNSDGIFKFVLQEVNTTEDDNQELGIADYYKHFPRNAEEEPDDSGDTSGDTCGQTGDGTGGSEDTTGTTGKKVWL